MVLVNSDFHMPQNLYEIYSQFVHVHSKFSPALLLGSLKNIGLKGEPSYWPGRGDPRREPVIWRIALSFVNLFSSFYQGQFIYGKGAGGGGGPGT
jgi:hypothetical protein